ncbi:MAG: hypothetical protein JW733_01390 [Coriobacteriia bacterium]|nr:hypothetical protein [Coriobacteriia bacterium]MBN2840539.1 hypothetical protein [Coriobacteriia bacterium]
MKHARAILALLLATATGCSVALPDGVIYPSITPDAAVTDQRTVDVSFTFEGQPVTFSLAVDGALYAGASAADKQVIRFGNARANDWIEDYFPAFVTEEHQVPFYDALIAAFRTVRDQRGLDPDRYAELMTAYVQSITYRIDPEDLSPKFPVETFVESAGDCDDKTLLLAALLSREGYDVAVLMFEPEQHVALGIRSQDLQYRDTGYAFVETTVPGYVGQVPQSLEGGVVLESVPRVFAIDGGQTAYGAGGQVAAILEARARAVAEAAQLATDITAADRALASLEARVNATRVELDALRSAGRIAEYNSRVDAYNALIAEYNRELEVRNELATRHNTLAAIDRTVAAGTADRRGTYAAIASF